MAKGWFFEDKSTSPHSNSAMNYESADTSTLPVSQQNGSVLSDETEPLVPECRHDDVPNMTTSSGFSSRTVECPTCQGKGYLSQSQADCMVALIPIRDSRLKPKRTKLYLCLTFLFCVITFSLVAFFLMPRSVTIELRSAESTNISISSNQSLTPYIKILATVQVYNGNFYEVKISSIATQVTWNGAVLNTSSSTSDMTVSSKSTVLRNITLTTLFIGEQKKKVRRVCVYGWTWKLTEEFLITAQVSNLGRQEQISNNRLFLIECYDYTKRRRREVMPWRWLSTEQRHQRHHYHID